MGVKYCRCRKKLDFTTSFCVYVNVDKDVKPSQILSVGDICDLMADENENELSYLIVI